MGIHHFDMLRMIFGENVARVACRSWNTPYSPFKEDAAAHALLAARERPRRLLSRLLAAARRADRLERRLDDRVRGGRADVLAPAGAISPCATSIAWSVRTRRKGREKTSRCPIPAIATEPAPSTPSRVPSRPVSRRHVSCPSRPTISARSRPRSPACVERGGRTLAGRRGDRSLAAGGLEQIRFSVAYSCSDLLLSHISLEEPATPFRKTLRSRAAWPAWSAAAAGSSGQGCLG